VVHRDLSPDNILISEGRPDQAKLIDFGIAKILETGDRTVVTGFKGKIAYASPEQFGMFSGRVSARSDLYSLGLVLAAAASGDPLPMGATVAEAVQARQQRPSIPPAIPPRLRAEIAPLLAPDPADRPASAEGLFAAQPTQEDRPQVALPRRRRLLAALAAIAVAAALLLALDLPSMFSRLPDLITGLTSGSEPADSRDAADTPPSDAFDRVRTQLLELKPVSDTEARVWTAPDPVPSGATYSVTFEADCNCQALLFSVDGSEDEIALLYPNNHDPRERLAPGRPLVLPSPGANPPYTLDALGGAGKDTLKLLLFQGELEFPSEIDFFTTAQRRESLVWTATREDHERLEELAELLRGEIWSTAQTPLRILESPGE
jgi:hypothetical protein